MTFLFALNATRLIGYVGAEDQTRGQPGLREAAG
jgi:hypothetical protein